MKLSERVGKMKRQLLKSYSEELREQVVKECIETNNYAAVSSKHKIPVTTIYGWIKRHKKSKVKRKTKNIRDQQKELKDLILENEILKELLKKSHQLWLKD
ncbi:MAG: transposase [Candidatus Anammoxibacter sp.]